MKVRILTLIAEFRHYSDFIHRIQTLFRLYSQNSDYILNLFT